MEVVLAHSPQGEWNDARARQLQALYHKGLSFSLIANEIGGITRNAAIAKAHRMHLPKRGKALQSKAPVRAGVPRPKRRDRLLIGRNLLAPSTKPFVEPEPKIVIEPGRDYRCSIYDLQNNSCRYPLWTASTSHPERLYCGCPAASVSNDIPYCEPHAMVCEAPPR